MVIEIRSARLLVDRPDVVVARYVEHHEATDAATDRLSTVVFERVQGSPNGLRWRTVHETWLPVEPARPEG